MNETKDPKYCPHCGLEIDGVTELPEVTEIKKSIRKHFRITPLWLDQKELQCLAFFRSEGATDEQFKRAADNWNGSKKYNWKAPTLKDIVTYWVELTATVEFNGYIHTKVTIDGDRSRLLETIKDEPKSSASDIRI